LARKADDRIKRVFSKDIDSSYLWQLRKLDKFGEKMENKMLSQDKLAKKRR
jgi:hypothetical protein